MHQLLPLPRGGNFQSFHFARNKTGDKGMGKTQSGTVLFHLCSFSSANYWHSSRKVKGSGNAMTSYTLTLGQQVINPSQLSIPQFLKNFFSLRCGSWRERTFYIVGALHIVPWQQYYFRLHQFILCTGQLCSWGHLLPVKAIQRAYLVASLRQWDATSKPHVTVSEMIPIMMKNNVVTHSGGSRGGIQVLSRPWMVWHCRTRPTVRAPENT